jgi:hypothetical protein
VHDNIKRVVEFMIQQQILNASATSDSEMANIWKKSWDSIGAFFTEMKSQVLGDQPNEVPAVIEPLKSEPENIS